MRFVLVVFMLTFSFHVLACADDFRGVEGYTVISVTQVDGDFEGCDFDKTIEFIDGTSVECSTYSYAYAFMPDAVIFGKAQTHNGRNFMMLKMLVDDEMYDLSPKLLRD